MHFVSDEKSLKPLIQDANTRIKDAFRPKTRRCYELLFRLFVGFCICSSVEVAKPTLSIVMAYLEFLVKNQVSVSMIANHVSALKAQFIIYGLSYHLLDHPEIRYFIKSLKINRPLTSVPRNIMSLDNLTALVRQCAFIPDGNVFKSIFLIAFFVFFRISNLAPHSLTSFDPSRHLTLCDITFKSDCMHIAVKWSKTLQTRDRIHMVTLPRLHGSLLCAVKALKTIIRVYNPNPHSPIFQRNTSAGLVVVTDSKIRKILSKLTRRLGFPPGHFTFHTFRRSGATLAFNSHVPIQQIKHHGSWTSDCVWRYIQQDEKYSKDIATTFATVIASR